MCIVLTPFSERLKEAMDMRQKRQVDICRDLHMNKGTVSGYMSGAHIPDSPVIGRLAKYLHVDPAWLTGYDVPVKDSFIAGIAGSLSELEISLLEKFRDLNPSGQAYLIDQLEYALSKDKYTKRGDVSEFESA